MTREQEVRDNTTKIPDWVPDTTTIAAMLAEISFTLARISDTLEKMRADTRGHEDDGK